MLFVECSTGALRYWVRSNNNTEVLPTDEFNIAPILDSHHNALLLAHIDALPITISYSHTRSLAFILSLSSYSESHLHPPSQHVHPPLPMHAQSYHNQPHSDTHSNTLLIPWSGTHMDKWYIQVCICDAFLIVSFMRRWVKPGGSEPHSVSDMSTIPNKHCECIYCSEPLVSLGGRQGTWLPPSQWF